MIAGLSIGDITALAQVVLLTASLFASIFFTTRIVRDARNTRREEDERHAELLREQTEARRAEDERHREESEKEAERRREEATRRRQVDLERRLERVAERVADIEELRWQMLDAQTGRAAMLRATVVRMRLRVAVISSGLALPRTNALVDLPQGYIVPGEDAINEALEEVEQSLETLALASRLPWANE